MHGDHQPDQGELEARAGLGRPRPGRREKGLEFRACQRENLGIVGFAVLEQERLANQPLGAARADAVVTLEVLAQETNGRRARWR